MSQRVVRRGGRPVIPNQPPVAPVREPYGQPKRFLWLRRVIVIMIGLALLIGLSAGLRVQSLKVEPAEYDALLHPQAEKLINDRLGWSHMLLLNSGSLAKQLEADNKTIVSGVKVVKDYPSRSLTITVGERVQAVRWQSGGKTYVVDGQGKVIQEAGTGSAADAPLVIDSSNLPVETNKVVASAGFIKFVVESNQALAAKTPLKPKQNRIADTTNELLVDTDKGFFIRFDTSRSVDEQIAEVNAVIAAEMPKQYLDVRLPYKAYYR